MAYIYLQSNSTEAVAEELLHHLGEIASILFFLLGAMTIVELIDSHHGFDIITDKINTTSKRNLLYIITVLTFFLSALLDNLTTTIVMVSLCAKLLREKEDRLWFTGMIIIAANAGGAWSPLGDVTTTMLWIGGTNHCIAYYEAVDFTEYYCLFGPDVTTGIPLSWQNIGGNVTSFTDIEGKIG